MSQLFKDLNVLHYHYAVSPDGLVVGKFQVGWEGRLGRDWIRRDVEVIIPASVTQSDIAVIETYIVQELVLRREQLTRKLHDQAQNEQQLMRYLESLSAKIETECEGTCLQGNLTFGGLAFGWVTLIVILTEPADYSASQSMCLVEFDSHSLKYGKLHPRHEHLPEITEVVRTKAKGLLVELYREERHKHVHANAYALCKTLEARRNL